MSIYNFHVTTIRGEQVSMSQYAGKVLLIVNTATQCGFTPQLKELQQLHEKYAEQGLAVLGFPCNQFGSQEPGANEQVEQTCQLNYGVTFPLFAKIEVNGAEADPLFKFLKEEQGGIFGDSIKWNFTKFLVDRQGKVVDRYAPQTSPLKIADAIEQCLASSLTIEEI